MSYSIFYFIFSILNFFTINDFQIKTLKIFQTLKMCLKIFKSNNFLGFLSFYKYFNRKIFLMKNLKY